MNGLLLGPAEQRQAEGRDGSWERTRSPWAGNERANFGSRHSGEFCKCPVVYCMYDLAV